MTNPQSLLHDVFVACRQRRRQEKIIDSLGAKLTGGDVLARAIGLRQVFRRRLADRRGLAAPVAVLLPPGAAAVVTNLALALDRRVTINLNYTLSESQLNDMLARSGARQVLTSHKFLERMPLALDAETICLEDLAPQVSPLDKLQAAALAYALPLPLVWRWLGLDQIAPDDPLMVVYTSGSTDQPKGVVLSQANIAASVRGVDSVLHLRPHDVLLGILPFFHSFGATINLWAVLANNISGVYHTNPLDAQIIGRLARQHRATILTATPMFLRAYAHRTEAADFASLEIVAAGGEALPAAVIESFDRKFGRRPFEAYGVTEMAPLISSNAPADRAPAGAAASSREGTVGQPVAGVRARVVDPETGADLRRGEPGLLLVTGPNVMQGYLNDPAATAKVLRDGWYVTGDIATIDDEGFITMVDRQSRFAKIAGEMVSFGAVERALEQVIGREADGAPRAVVTAVPDAGRGERLVVVHIPLSPATRPQTIRRLLKDQGLPNLLLPGADSFIEVASLPILGSGKLDLKAIKQIALDELVPDRTRLRTDAPAA